MANKISINIHEEGRRNSGLPPFGSAEWDKRNAAEIASRPTARTLNRRPLTTDELNELGRKINERGNRRG